MKLGMGIPRECNYAHAPTIQHSTTNHQHLPSLQDARSLDTHKNFKELPHTLIENQQSQTECTNLLGALPTSNPKDYIQLSRDIHEMSSNGAHP